MSDLLVRGGRVLDGLGSPPFTADIRVRDGRITEIGENLPPGGEVTLDASDALVSPGFIDSHTHYDPTVFWDPSCDPMPQHGVTSVLTGNCSLSLAPIRPDAQDLVTSLFCYIEDLPEAAFDVSIPWNWESYPEYLDQLSHRAFGVNQASLIGHNLLRLYVVGDQAWERPSTAAERSAMAGLLDDALRAGAFGLSTSLGFDEDRSKRPVPSRIADDAEFTALFEVLARHGKFVQFIPAPGKHGVEKDIRRMAGLCGPLGVLNTWIGVFDDKDHPEISGYLLDVAAELQAGGVRTYPQVSPRTLDIQVNWAGGMAFYTLPLGWHRLVQADPTEKRRLLHDPQWRAAARAEWDLVPASMVRHRTPERIRLLSVTRPEHEEWVNRTLADLIAERGGHPSDVLADWVLANDLAPGIVAVGVANSDPEGVARTLLHPAAVISNSDAGAHLQMFCAAGDSTLLLTRHVRERHDFTVEEAVHQLTGRQAELFGFHDRGVIRHGAVADLTVFALDELSWDDDAFVNDLPAGARRLRRPGGGYRYTTIAGVVTQEAGALTGALPGTVLRP